METPWISTIGDSRYRELAPGIKLTVTRRILTKDDKNPPYQAFFNRLVLKNYSNPRKTHKRLSKPSHKKQSKKQWTIYKELYHESCLIQQQMAHWKRQRTPFIKAGSLQRKLLADIGFSEKYYPAV